MFEAGAKETPGQQSGKMENIKSSVRPDVLHPDIHGVPNWGSIQTYMRHAIDHAKMAADKTS